MSGYSAFKYQWQPEIQQNVNVRRISRLRAYFLPGTCESPLYPTYDFGVDASLGILGGGGLSWNPIGGYYANDFSSEVGIIMIAQLGISISYSAWIPFFNTHKEEYS